MGYIFMFLVGALIALPLGYVWGMDATMRALDADEKRDAR